MKTLPLCLAFLCLTVCTTNLSAQHVKLLEGNVAAVKAEKNIALEFAYDNMRVGKYDKEDDYVNEKKTEYNKKEAGRGDSWAKTWVDDRKYKFEPKFKELFERYSEKTISPNAKYTIIFKTTFTEPGFNVGVMRKSATIDGEAWIVETANKSNVIAKIRVEKAPGHAVFSGNDYDSGDRVAESYATAGRAVGKFVRD